jgi:hypothetical protein
MSNLAIRRKNRIGQWMKRSGGIPVQGAGTSAYAQSQVELRPGGDSVVLVTRQRVAGECLPPVFFGRGLCLLPLKDSCVFYLSAVMERQIPQCSIEGSTEGRL